MLTKKTRKNNHGVPIQFFRVTDEKSGKSVEITSDNKVIIYADLNHWGHGYDVADFVDLCYGTITKKGDNDSE